MLLIKALTLMECSKYLQKVLVTGITTARSLRNEKIISYIAHLNPIMRSAPICLANLATQIKVSDNGGAGGWQSNGSARFFSNVDGYSYAYGEIVSFDYNFGADFTGDVTTYRMYSSHDGVNKVEALLLSAEL